MSILANLEPRMLWKHFDEIRKIPRSSGNEAAIGQYVISVAKRLGLDYTQDKTGNIVIRKPGSKGHENAPSIVLQSHLDMVCEKNSSKIFAFDSDAIQLQREGDWIKADGTTLGADNGIGVAASLAVLEEEKLTYGPVEALFTVDEERGLVGARTISSKALKGRIMINLDSEDIGIFSIGCAGGADSILTLPVRKVQPKGDTLLQIHLLGLRGGHSGVDIHEGRGNALKIMNRLLYQVGRILPLELVGLSGGDKHNAIPREAVAEVVVPSQDVAALKKWFKKALEEIRIEFHPVEQGIDLKITALKQDLPKVLTVKSQDLFLGLVFALPHGPLAMSRTIKDLVETSNNVASIKNVDNKMVIHCSSRSSNGAALQATRDKLLAIAQLVGAKINQPEGYPGWMPNLDSPVLKVAMETFKKVAKKDAKYMAIHAGLECGIIGEKFPGMDMISIGPTIKHPHSPDERVEVETVSIFYDHLLAMLKALA